MLSGSRRFKLIRIKPIKMGLMGACLGLGLVLPCFSLAENPGVKSRSCPTEVEVLTEWMLPDLPSYANRVMQRSQSNDSRQNFVLVAGKPEFEPLTLPNRQFAPTLTDKKSVQQVFFTTLEHQYSASQRVSLQNFYWLLLTQTDEGWRVVALSTKLASLHAQDPPLPPIEVTEGVMGQAIQLWLRDCRTGSLSIQRRS